MFPAAPGPGRSGRDRSFRPPGPFAIGPSGGYFTHPAPRAPFP